MLNRDRWERSEPHRLAPFPTSPDLIDQVSWGYVSGGALTDELAARAPS